MKYKLLLSGIISGLLVFAMMLFAGCGDGSDGGNGGGDDTYTVSFDRGEGGGSAPSSRTVADGTTITLPGQGDMTAPSGSGKTFNGWSMGGTRYQAGDSYTVRANTLFTAQWTTGNSGGNSDTKQEGVYIGIISFAGDAVDLTGGVPVFLDATGKNNLISKLTSDYTISSAQGTALFYAVHKAFANLKSRDTQYPANLDSVNVVTFTDGLDNGSNGKSAQDSIEGQTFDSDDEYTSYLNGQIGSRTIAGKPITAYAVGIQGNDVTNVTKFQNDLAKIASTGKSQTLTDFGTLQATFKNIADGLQIAHSSTTFTMKTTLLGSGTKVRMTFDVTGDSAADGAGSTKYIEGTITRTGTGASMAYTFGSISYTGGLGSTQGAGPITGTVNGSEVNFAFTGVEGYTPATEESKAKQWLMSPGTTEWQVNSEYDVGGATNTQIEKRSSIIYLVLDSSRSLDATQIGVIKSSAQEFINSLYNQLGGSSSGGDTPSAPTGVSASAVSSSSIEVTWQSVTNTSYYRVYRATSASGSYESMGETYDTKYTDTNVSAGTTYYYKIIAVNGTGQSSYSSYAYATPSSSSSGALSAPTGVSASVYSGAIEVTWQSVANASYYMIYRATSAYGSYESLGDTYDTKYTDTNVSAGTTYYYKIIAVNDAGQSSYSSYASATPSSSGYSAVPSAPTGVTASAYSNAIEVTWQSVANASYYRVYRYRGTSGYTYENYYETSYTYYTDTNLSTGTTYYYQVVAVNSEGYEGNYSSYAYATTSSSGNSAPSAPTDVTASAYSDSIEVTWQSVANASYYMIYRATSASGSYESVGDTYYTYYTDTNVSAGTTYYYKVVAVNSAGYESSMSSYASAATSSSSISLSYGTWYDNTLSAGDTHYYSFYAYSGTTYLVLWQDYDYDTYYGDIKVSATTSGGSPLFTNVDEGYYYGESFSVSSSGYITLTVTGNSASSYGAYRIGYNY
jgi:fibronectin type 3 domain-containing protein